MDILLKMYIVLSKSVLFNTKSWTENKMAGKELMTSFLKRNLKLSIR